MLECPNDDLYTPLPTVIGIDIEPGKDDSETMQKSLDSEKEKWQESIGDCFAGSMFDTFFQQAPRTMFLGCAHAYNLTTTIDTMTVSKQSDNIQHILVTLNVTAPDSTTEQFEPEWQIIYDTEEPELLQSIKLLNDDNFWNSYANVSYPPVA